MKRFKTTVREIKKIHFKQDPIYKNQPLFWPANGRAVTFESLKTIPDNKIVVWECAPEEFYHEVYVVERKTDKYCDIIHVMKWFEDEEDCTPEEVEVELHHYIFCLED